MVYCFTTGECISLCGAIASFLAIVVALVIAFWQRKQDNRKKEEEYQDIGEVICELIRQLAYLVDTQVCQGYEGCIDKLMEDPLSQPEMKIVPLVSINKLNKLSPELVYKTFKYNGLKGITFNNFILHVDSISSSLELNVENYRLSESRIVELKNKYKEQFRTLKLLVNQSIQKMERDGNFDTPLYNRIKAILSEYLTKDVNRANNLDDFAYSMQYFVERIKNEFLGKNEKELIDVQIINSASILQEIYSTIELSNTEYIKYLCADKEQIWKDMEILLDIGKELNGGKDIVKRDNKEEIKLKQK